MGPIFLWKSFLIEISAYLACRPRLFFFLFLSNPPTRGPKVPYFFAARQRESSFLYPPLFCFVFFFLFSLRQHFWYFERVSPYWKWYISPTRTYIFEFIPCIISYSKNESSISKKLIWRLMYSMFAKTALSHIGISHTAAKQKSESIY